MADLALNKLNNVHLCQMSLYCNVRFMFFSFSDELNDVRFSAYRTAMKIRMLQKKLRCKLITAIILMLVDG